MTTGKAECKKQINEFASNTTSHGVRYVLGENIITPRRLIWLLILVGMASGFVVTFVTSLGNFLKYESTLSMSLVKNKTLTFPAITVCNLNMFMKSKVEKQYPSMTDLIKLLYTHNITLLTESISKNPEILNVTVPDFYTKTKYDLDSTIIQCSLNQVQLNCSDYLEELFTDKGICQTFNSGSTNTNRELLMAKSAGMMFSLSLTLDLQPLEYVFPTSYGTAVSVLIHDQSVYPMMEWKSFLVGPGKQVFVPIEKEIKHNLPYPYTSEDCIVPQIDSIKDSYTGYIYSEERCIYHCLEEMYENIYGNCKLWVSGVNQIECTLINSLLNYQIAMEAFTDRSDECQCLPTCDNTNYNYLVTSSDISHARGENYAKSQNWNVTTLPEVRSRYSEIKVYYSSMKYTEIVQHPAINMAQLFSNLGGQMGLYLGASLITVIEFIDLLIRLCSGCMRNDKDRQSRLNEVPSKTSKDVPPSKTPKDVLFKKP